MTSDDAPAGHPVAEFRLWSSHAGESRLAWHQCRAHGYSAQSEQWKRSFNFHQWEVTFLRRRDGEYVLSTRAASRALVSWYVLAGFNVGESFASCASLEECASMGMNSQTRSSVSELGDADILKGQSGAWCSDLPLTDRFAIPTSSDNHPHGGSESMSDTRNPATPRQLSSMLVLPTGVVPHKSKSIDSSAHQPGGWFPQPRSMRVTPERVTPLKFPGDRPISLRVSTLRRLG